METIGIKSVKVERTVAPVAPARPTLVATAQPEAPAAAATADAAQLSGLAKDMAASPPVDLDRVAKIKKAIADGSFPLVPATIADRLIALQLNWKPHDEA